MRIDIVLASRLKLGIILENKVSQKLKLLKNAFYKQLAYMANSGGHFSRPSGDIQVEKYMKWQ